LLIGENTNKGTENLRFNLPTILEIRDLQGKNIYTENVISSDGEYEIDLSHLKTGTYFLHWKNNNQNLKYKL